MQYSDEEFTAAQTKPFATKPKAIAAARAVLWATKTIPAALSMVHFNVVEVENGWCWKFIPQEQAPPTPHRPRRANGAVPDVPAAQTPAPSRRASAPARDARAAPHPPTSGNLPRPVDPVKDTHMPPLGRAGKAANLPPKGRVYPPKAGSKYGTLCVLLDRPQGMTLGEAYDALTAAGEWRRIVIRPALVYKINRVAGYGIRQEDWDGRRLLLSQRTYEAQRLGMVLEGDEWTPGAYYNPAATLPVFFLIVPEGAKAPAKKGAAE